MIIVEMKKHFRERAIEWWAASLLAAWGAYVLWYPGLFAALPPTNGLLRFAPQFMWGLVALGFGLLRLIALTVNGFWYRTPMIRLVAAFLCVFVWFMIVVGSLLSPFPSLGIILYGWSMIADMYSTFRSASDTYEAEAQGRLKKMSISTQPVGDPADVSSFISK